MTLDAVPVATYVGRLNAGTFTAAVVDYDVTILPPKKYFVPPAEELMKFSTKDNEVISAEVHAHPRVIFGLHPCDINALMLMDNVFLGEYEDPYYKARRESTLIVGVSCEPNEQCFCNAWGTDEVHWGFDIFLSDLGDEYFVSVSSVKGADLLDHYVETRHTTHDDVAEFLGCHQTPLGAYRIGKLLAGGGGLGPHLTRGVDHVLRADRVLDIGHGQG